MGLRMKHCNMEVHWKMHFLGGRGSQKTNIWGNWLKRGLGEFANLRGGGGVAEEGGGVFGEEGGGWYPNAHYVKMHQICCVQN